MALAAENTWMFASVIACAVVSETPDVEPPAVELELELELELLDDPPHAASTSASADDTAATPDARTVRAVSHTDRRS